MTLTILSGKLILPEIQNQGIDQFLTQNKSLGKSLFTFLGTGFPFGAGITIIGAALFAKTEQKKLWTFLWIFLFAAVLISLLSNFINSNNNTTFYVIIGALIMIIFVLIAWLWARNRIKLERKEQHYWDIKMAGYFFFIIASWELCGVGVVPFFTFYPESFSAYNSMSFVIAQTKLVLILFLIGWFFILLANYTKYAHLRKKKKKP